MSPMSLVFDNDRPLGLPERCSGYVVRLARPFELLSAGPSMLTIVDPSSTDNVVAFWRQNPSRLRPPAHDLQTNRGFVGRAKERADLLTSNQAQGSQLSGKSFVSESLSEFNPALVSPK